MKKREIAKRLDLYEEAAKGLYRYTTSCADDEKGTQTRIVADQIRKMAKSFLKSIEVNDIFNH